MGGTCMRLEQFGILVIQILPQVAHHIAHLAVIQSKDMLSMLAFNPMMT